MELQCSVVKDTEVNHKDEEDLSDSYGSSDDSYGSYGNE